MLFDYDSKSTQSILNYAKKLEGKTFRDILNVYEKSDSKSYEKPKSNFVHLNSSIGMNAKAKGQLGSFLEMYYFGYGPNSKQEADFAKTGVELKTTCVNQLKSGELSAGERLSITNISFNEPVEENFFKSHLFNKINKLLLVHYLRNKKINRLDNTILFVNMFNFASEKSNESDCCGIIKLPKKDLKIILDDYNTIIQKIKAGKAHELSESDTLYLGAATKGSTAEESIRPQFYGDHIPAKKRNFCFKRQYMDYILKQYILKNNDCYESILPINCYDSKNISFEEYTTNKINNYAGKTDEELCYEFNREYNNNKAQWSDLAYRILGIKSSKAEEFIKANIVVRSIRLEENGKNKESIPLPTINFIEFSNETWENSKLLDYLETTRFLFVIYRKQGNHYILTGSKFWNMPYNDLHFTVKDGWIKTQKIINEGVVFTPIEQNGNLILSNNLPKKTDNEIIHIRPHAQKRAYKLKNGISIGNLKDADKLPDGQWMTIQSFWINNDYILKQIIK